MSTIHFYSATNQVWTENVKNTFASKLICWHLKKIKITPIIQMSNAYVLFIFLQYFVKLGPFGTDCVVPMISVHS